MQAYIYKFYPYYHDNLKVRDNDMMGWALITSLLGFLMVMLAGYIFKDLVVRKFSAHILPISSNTIPGYSRWDSG